MIVIGELVNATRKKVRQAVIDHDEELVRSLVVSQKESGADYIDINVGTGKGDANDEIENMKWAVGIAIDAAGDNVALSIDSANNDVLRAGLEAAPSGTTHFINSVTAESERLEPTLALVKEFNTNVVALAMSDDGIKVEVDLRVEAAKMIREKAAGLGIADSQLYFDPLVMPLGTDPKNPELTLQTGRSILDLYPEAHLTMGLSNVSHGLPQRKLLNRVFLTLALQAGFDSAIIDPNDEAMMDAVHASEALLGKDEFCMNYIQYIKSKEE